MPAVGTSMVLVTTALSSSPPAAIDKNPLSPPWHHSAAHPGPDRPHRPSVFFMSPLPMGQQYPRIPSRCSASIQRVSAENAVTADVKMKRTAKRFINFIRGFPIGTNCLHLGKKELQNAKCKLQNVN